MSTRSRVRNGTLDQDCETAKRRISRALARADYDLVLMSLRWVVYEPRITLAEIAELAGLTGGAPLMIIGPTPYPENKRPCDRPTAFGSNPCGSFLPTEDDLDENRRITAIASTLGLPYVDLFQAGCGLRGCLLYEENTALYADATHLSTHGSDFYVARVEPRILSALAWSKSNRTLGSTAW